MLTTPKRLLAVLALALGACGGPEPVLLPTPAVAPQDRVRIAYASVELRDVSLPSYAAGEDIFLRGVDRGNYPVARQFTLGIQLGF